KHVIDTTVKDWSGTKYEKYLRPETLFGSKFEGYLNQAPRIKTETTDERLGF
ncbi:TPA: conserved phage C-terminal domain-containing protein, partial [Streptococcus agalactiae]